MATHRIAVIPGDGIGKEVMPEGLRAVEAAAKRHGVSLAFTQFDWNCDHFVKHGRMMPEDWFETLSGFEAIYYGAVGWPATVPDHVSLWGSLIPFRRGFDQYVNLRPSRLYPGVPTPLAPEVTRRGPVDFVVVREGTEGLYCGNGGVVRAGTPHEIATEVSVNTAHGVERVVRDAYERAARRRGHLTLVHKHNVLVNAGGLWNRLFSEVGEEYPGVERDYLHVDAATIAMVVDPQRFDVIVTDNLFGDILTDLSAAVTGGIGLAASANINPEGAFPSMFEPVHGSAPDIAGQGIADPTATILSMALLLDHLGRPDDARAIEAAVDADIAERGASKRPTSAVGDDILARLR